VGALRSSPWACWACVRLHAAGRVVEAWPLRRGRLVAVLLAILGALLVVAGVAAIFWPAALIVAGVLLLAGLFGPFFE
jgi:hypothetical protein